MKNPELEKLIQEIAMFDMDAACKLYERKDKCGECEILRGVMVWGNTEEGHAYWSDINMRLEARRKNYHPHRDLMIEYANDKTIEIEFLVNGGKWDGANEPSFYPKYKYRKKPKVTKKVIEYRVYLDKKNEIHMIERQDLIHPAHFKEWLGDWQKVEIEVEQND